MAAELEGWFAKLPEAWQERAQRIRELILEAAPGMQEKWMFKSTPFYIHHGWLCYFNFRKGQLILGFCAGARMGDPDGLLVGDQLVVRHFLPSVPPARKNEAALRRLLDEAVRLNEAIAAERSIRRNR